MALIADMDGFNMATGSGYIDGTTLNIPKTKDPEGNEVAAVSYGAATVFGEDGSILVQQIIGFEQVENVHPSTYQRINTFDGNGYGEWLKIG